MDGTLMAFLIILTIIFVSGVALFIAAWLRDDVRMMLFAKILIPVYIIAGKDHMVRDQRKPDVYTFIREIPGVTYSRLLTDLRFDNETLVFHLMRLQREGIISTMNDNGILSFAPGFVATPTPQAGHLPPMSPLERMILQNLRQLGPAARTEIQQTLSVTPFHLKQALVNLRLRGLIDYDGEGQWSYCWAIDNPPKVK